MLDALLNLVEKTNDRLHTEYTIRQIQLVLILVALLKRAEETWESALEGTIGTLLEGPVGRVWNRFVRSYEAATEGDLLYL